MHRAWTLAWTLAAVASLMVGCIPLEGTRLEAGRTSAELTLRPIEESNGWQLELIVGGDETVELRYERSDRGVRRVRREALQADGAWVERESNERYPRALNHPASVSPGGTLLLGNGDHTFTDLHEDPGTYRIVVRVRRPNGEGLDVTLEYTVVGWSEEMLEEGERLQARAMEAGCSRIPLTVRADLIEHLEPDALIELHQRSPSHRASSHWTPFRTVLEEMLERGGFVVFLSEHLAIAPMGDVRAVANWLPPRDQVQRPLRPIVATRLIAPLFSHGAAIEAQDYSLIARLHRYWPAAVPERVVTRLEEGPEFGDSLRALLGLLTSRPLAFEGLRDRIWAALPRRCEGVRDEWLTSNCERARQIYAPESLDRTGSSSAFASTGTLCGGPNRPAPVCGMLRREWNALTAQAGEGEVVWLSGEVLEVTDG